MGSKKRQAWAKQKAQFRDQLYQESDSRGGVLDFAEKRPSSHAGDANTSLKRKACTSKKRYPNQSSALAAIDACADYGTTGLHCYRCPHCNGWHLTSKPQTE